MLAGVLGLVMQQQVSNPNRLHSSLKLEALCSADDSGNGSNSLVWSNISGAMAWRSLCRLMSQIL